MITTAQLSSAILQDIDKELDTEVKRQIALKGLGIGITYIGNMPKTGRLQNRNILKRQCYNHLLSEYYNTPDPTGFVLTTIILWFVIRTVLWWLAEKLLERWLDNQTAA